MESITVVMLPNMVVMLPFKVVMLPGFVVMEPANALEASTTVSNEVQRIDLMLFISFLLVNRAFAGVVGVDWGSALESSLVEPNR